MVSPVPPIAANIYMEEVEAKALTSFSGTTPRHWFRYVDDTRVKIKTKEVDHIIKFTREDVRDSILTLDCAVHIQANRSLNTSVQKEHRPLCSSHHPLRHKLGAVQKPEPPGWLLRKEREGESHIRKSSKRCGYLVFTRKIWTNQTLNRSNARALSFYE